MQTKDLKEISKRFIWTDFAGYLVSKVLYFLPKKAKTRKENIKELSELLDHAIQSAIEDKGKEIEKEIYKHYKDETVASGHRIWNEALDLSVSIVGRLSGLSKK